MNEKQIINTFEEIEKSLNNNALFKLSLGSKELFHSNIIESLLGIHDDKGVQFALHFFNHFGIKGLDKESKILSIREKNNSDIVFKFFRKSSDTENDKPYKTVIIENKVKSLPDKDQLERYKNKKEYKDKKNHDFYLLSLIKPEFDVKKIGWKSKFYIHLADSLEEALADSKNNIGLPEMGKRIKFKDLVKEYISFSRTLSQLGALIKTKPNDAYNFWNGEKPINFRELRIHDLFLKLKYRQIGELIEKNLNKDHNVIWGLKKEEIPLKNVVYLNHDFTRSKGLFDIKILLGNLDLPEEKHAAHMLAVQIQGNQFRYCSYLHTAGLTKTEIKTLHKEAVTILASDWFDNKILDLSPEDRKGLGKSENENENPPGYVKFGDEFYFKYDYIAYSKEHIGKMKNNDSRKNHPDPTIEKIVNSFIILTNHILDYREQITKTIEDKTTISYLK